MGELQAKLTVKLKRPDGEVTSVALEKLSRYDQLYVRKLARDMDAAVQAQVSAISRAEDILKRIKKLGETKSPTNVGILLGLLQHTNSHVRLAAAQSLEKIGDETLLASGWTRHTCVDGDGQSRRMPSRIRDVLRPSVGLALGGSDPDDPR